MKITWVNHASFIISYKEINLICDPWMEGTAFNNGWSLVSKTKFKYEDFAGITHIWFSHEHPDHFSPPNLKKISAEHKKNITVMYQQTIDRKVEEYCLKAGFKEVIPMKPDIKYNLSADFAMICNPFTDGDSWLFIETPEQKLLNLNDCIVCSEDDAKLIWQLTGNVDVLFTQFSYANWAFNKEEKEKRRMHAIEKLERMKPQSDIFNPKVIVPFASFVWFCHEDNFYLNDEIIHIDRAVNFIEKDLQKKAIVFYPGDEWELFSSHDNSAALQKYSTDYNIALTGQPLFFNKKIELEALKSKANDFALKLKKINKTFGLYLLPPAQIYLTDYQQSFTFSFGKGLAEAGFTQDECDIAVSSSNLLFCFEFLWGGDSLNVNGCFQIPPKGNFDRFRQYFDIASKNNRGELFPSLPNRIAYRIKRIFN